jgi:hypothetical protein
LLDSHSQRVGDQRCFGPAVDRPADDTATEGIENHGTVHLALAGRVLGDVGDPELIATIPLEVPSNTILGRGDVGHASVAGPPRNALKPGSTHQSLYGFLADANSVP